MYHLLYAGFDSLDVAFAGALPIEALEELEQARLKAQESQEDSLLRLGPGKLDMHVKGYGSKGGYAYVMDTGPTGIIWKVKKNNDIQQWNLFASPRATLLLSHGYQGTRDKLYAELEAMGAKVTNHSINRVDFAMDFRTKGFELHQDQFVAHSHTKVSPHWGEKQDHKDRSQPSAVLRGRRLESMTVGKQPGRQIIVYDKRREATEKQKHFWFKAWGEDRHNPDLEVWRVEARAGKKELKDKYQIRTFHDFETAIGDVIVNALDEVRYLDDWQSDSNVTRQALHPLWTAAQEVANRNLLALRAGLTPGQIKKVERAAAQETYLALCIGNAIGLGVSKGLSDNEIQTQLPILLRESIARHFRAKGEELRAAIKRTRDRLVFLE
ncbi:hypothetical protein [Limibacillus halophilus]|uniref:Replication initiation factor n=1 Tax=Limibacillus halophilus TaxID=1579333 RepID=A0A839SSP6_9PROT|nr:hypothetical protein [Limibacillus halophilus]MBB3065348.1 hypothetical protein [Limibacillus halophilus]